MSSFNPHPQEAEILAFCDSSQSVEPHVRLNSCETIKDVKKFLKTQKTVIINKPSKRQYVLSIARLKNLKDVIHGANN